MIEQLVTVTHDAAGLEKTMRLIQGVCTIGAATALSAANAATWRQAQSQLALGVSLDPFPIIARDPA